MVILNLGLLRTFSFFLLKVLYLRKLLSPRKAEKIEHPRNGNIFIWMVMILESLGLYYYREFIAWHEIAQNKDYHLASFLSRCGHMTKVWTMGQKCNTWNIRVIHGSLRERMSSLLASPTIVDNDMILKKIVTSVGLGSLPLWRTILVLDCLLLYFLIKREKSKFL